MTELTQLPTAVFAILAVVAILVIMAIARAGGFQIDAKFPWIHFSARGVTRSHNVLLARRSVGRRLSQITHGHGDNIMELDGSEVEHVEQRSSQPNDD